MKIVRSVRTMRRVSSGWKARRQRIALVPTMGSLHAGHAALIRAARRAADRVVVSVFVNPIQFNDLEDYRIYPKNLAKDARLARESGADALFAPTIAQMYPNGFGTFVEVEGATERWEGEFRPGHFRGVATVVAKLFSIVAPDSAFFGLKDYQQTVVILKMVRDLDLSVRIRALPTVRERDGLALSSRNGRLSPTGRKAAPRIYQSLLLARALFRAGERRAGWIRAALKRFLGAERGIRVEYIALCGPEGLEPVERVFDGAVVLVAVRIAGVRLIDNLILSSS